MIKLVTAHTANIDDPETAVEEILEQIDRAVLLRNSSGIVGCCYEFAETGVISALCERLPFDVIGCSTLGSAVNGGHGAEQLSLAVLTSDEATFSTSFSPPMAAGSIAEPVADAWRQARGKLGGDPSLIFALGPISSGDGVGILRRLDALSGGLPIFGTLSSDSALSLENSFVFCDGKISKDSMALLLVRGAVHPRFSAIAISSKNIQSRTAVVTGSEGNLLKEVDGMPVGEYLAKIGVRVFGPEAVTILPFMVDYGDGAKPVAVSMYSITPEGVYCAGEIPVGAKIAMAEVDGDSVMETAEAAVNLALEDVRKNGGNGLIAIPCFTRGLLLSPRTEDEMARTRELVGDAVPFLFIYSGGEMCPLYRKDGAISNRFHNMTYTLVVF
ncbi:MAG: FIST C-terminal domain-containing protein [Desulfovibrio sp.]|jgi:hypothetical protein|nr:FIST C-terminal domain-containing protein [Desulfovibrio sp.]